MDTQIVELIGRNHLTSELLRAGLEVAAPVRDRGVDLIAYDERKHEFFVACPIQMKAAMKRSFSVATKYEPVRNLIIAYVWHLEDESQRVTYALTYEEAFSIAKTMGWTRTESWKGGAYSTTHPSAKLVALLDPYRMTPEKWRAKVTRLMDYAEREQQKTNGWSLYESGSTPAERARGLLMIIEAHFYRNPEAPSLNTYASHWLWSSQGRFDREVMDLLIARYPLPSHPRIQRGYSDWNSYGDPSYKITASCITD
ncbi:MAG: hypothetical protein ABIP85_22520 [Chthoniobacteraceae bacterium]